MPNQPNFPIPENLTPETFCLCLQIPNDPTWVQTFVGLLAQPTYWFNWERDEARSGKTLAQYWSKLFDQIDWSTMSCCCPENPVSSTNYLLNWQIALTLQQMDTGTVASYAPNAPNTTFSTDSRDTTPEQEAATAATLCYACDQFVRQQLAEQLNAAATTALEAAAVGGAAGLINPIAGVLITLVGALPYATWLEVANDADAIHNVVCQLYAGMFAETPTFAHFEGALTGASYSNTNATTLGNAVDVSLHTEQNFRAFMVFLGVKVDGTTNPCADCICDVTAYWGAGGGTITPAGNCTWDFESIPESGHYAIYVWFNNPTTTFDPTLCGKMTAITTLTGSIGLQGYNDCGTGTLHFPALTVDHIEASQLYFQSTAPFSLRMTFSS